MKKDFIIGLAIGLTVAGASLVLANSQIQVILNNQIKVTLNGQVQEFKDEITNETQYPITYHGRTYLPLRTVANLVGVYVDYDAESNTAKLMDNFVLYDEMAKLDFSNSLSNDFYNVAITPNGKTITHEGIVYATNLTKNIKSFKLVRNGYSESYIALTEDGELYMCEFPDDSRSIDFELLGSGYDAISNDIRYSRSDYMADPFVARTIEKDNINGEEINFVDYTIFMSKEDKIHIYERRP